MLRFRALDERAVGSADLTTEGSVESATDGAPESPMVCSSDLATDGKANSREKVEQISVSKVV